MLASLLLYGKLSLAKLDALRTQLRPLLNAIAVVESNNNDSAIGDNGKAIGRYQIWQVYWHDAIEVSPEMEKRYLSVRDKIYAERIVVAYLYRYGKRAIENSDYETLARIHNGGPKGFKKQATVKYWNLVKKHIRYYSYRSFSFDL